MVTYSQLGTFLQSALTAAAAEQPGVLFKYGTEVDANAKRGISAILYPTGFTYVAHVGNRGGVEIAAVKKWTFELSIFGKSDDHAVAIEESLTRRLRALGFAATDFSGGKFVPAANCERGRGLIATLAVTTIVPKTVSETQVIESTSDDTKAL